MCESTIKIRLQLSKYTFGWEFERIFRSTAYIITYDFVFQPFLAMKLLLSALAGVCLSATIPDNAVSIPHEAEIIGNGDCDGEQEGSSYVATFKADLFVHNTVLTIPEGATANDFLDVEGSNYIEFIQ